MSAVSTKIGDIKELYWVNQKTIVASFLVLIVGYLVSPDSIYTVTIFISNSLVDLRGEIYKWLDNSSVAAFIGALLATMGIWIINTIERQKNQEAEKMRLLEAREKVHHNCLVDIEYYCIQCANDIYANLVWIEDLLAFLQKLVKEGGVTSYYDSYFQFEINTGVSKGLLNIDLVNKISDLNIDLKRLNGAFENVNYLLIRKNIQKEDLDIFTGDCKIEYIRLRDDLLSLKEEVKRVEQSNIEILADTKVLAKKSSVKPTTNDNHKITEEERKEEKIVIEKRLIPCKEELKKQNE